jgi:hypothetical protein
MELSNASLTIRLTDDDEKGGMRTPLRLLFMVHELHKRGYEKIRIAPYMASSGMHWRCQVVHAGAMSETHGAMIDSSYSDSVHVDTHGEAALYSSADGDSLFAWSDAMKDAPDQLASKFIVRFPHTAHAGKGSDTDYAAWYVQMLAFAKMHALPIAFANWYSPPTWYPSNAPQWLPTTHHMSDECPSPLRIPPNK